MSEETLSFDNIVEQWAFREFDDKAVIKMITELPKEEITQEGLGFMLYASLVYDSPKVFKFCCKLGAICELYHLNYLKEHDLRMRWYRRIKKVIRGFDDVNLQEFRDLVIKNKRRLKNGSSRKRISVADALRSRNGMFREKGRRTGQGRSQRTS